MPHASEPISLPDVDNGLRLIRWRALGLDELRRTGLLSHKARFELVDGMLLERENASGRHDRVVEELAERLRAVLAPPAWEVRADHELRLDELDSVVSPDIAVVVASGSLPRLVVEVSETAPRLDAQEKERLYARAGIEEYWHVDLAWNVWRTHALPHRDGYGMRTSGPPDRTTVTGLDGWDPTTLDELLAAADAAA